MADVMDLGRRSIAEWAESAPQEDAATFIPAEQKFTVETPIGKGGMGEVFLVTDKDLRRQVAMKVLREDTGMGREQRLHFVAEAQATSQLEHPGIPPVHDIGLTGDGRPYFTMKLVRGRTAKEVLHDLAAGVRAVTEEYTLHRLVSILERICEALHFAHERGVLHRDIKPENVMLGDYGEVHLMDWGLAKVGPETGQIHTARVDSGVETQFGSIKGTLPYMSPEQLLGHTDEIDQRTDVYALGGLLYEMLTLHPAFDPSDRELLVKVQTASYADVSKRNPQRTVPAPLADICRKAMARVRQERYDNADQMRLALRAWLDGRAERERRHEEAEKLAARGKEAAARYESLKAQVGEAEAAAEAEAAKYKLYQPVREKRPVIEAARRVEALKTEVVLAFAETTRLLDAALTQEGDNATARATLAELWTHQLHEAERFGNRADTAHTLAMVGRYTAGSIPSDGSLLLMSDPPGADVTIYRYEEVDGVLTPGDEKQLGPTPVGPAPLPMGSYLCVLKKGGFRDTRYPVHITRERHWRGEVKLRADPEIGDGFVYVPKGPFLYGIGKETRTVSLEDFAIGKYPVTCGEYGEFLDQLGDEKARERCPHTEHQALMERGEDGRWRVAWHAVDDRVRELCLERYGEGFESLLPVTCVSWHDSVAYCEWKSRMTGLEWRLPTEQEREKAARGVDGRHFAWGDLADSSLGKCRDSRSERPQPEPVGAFPSAESVYGMGDASGGVWDWTDSIFDERSGVRVLRGGSWNDGVSLLYCANRHWFAPARRLSLIGFRCARSL